MTGGGDAIGAGFDVSGEGGEMEVPSLPVYSRPMGRHVGGAREGG